jgi:hypothetical protein
LEKNIQSNFSKILEEGKALIHSFSSPKITDEKFLEENFASIFFRALVAKSFLEISEIKTYQNYAGSGFKDFSSIISIFNFDAKNLENLFSKNRSKILSFFKSLQ